MSSPITPDLRAKLTKDMYHEHRLGYWLPKDRKLIIEWTRRLMKKIREPKEAPTIDPLLLEFKDFIEGHPILGPLSNDMFTEVPDIPPYNEDPQHQPEVRSFGDMIVAFNALLTIGPTWNYFANLVGLIGCPFNAVLDWPMATASGYMFFLYPVVNQWMQQILHKWEQFLLTEPSTECLMAPDGWFGAEGMKALVVKGNQDGMQPMPAELLPFEKLYQCPDPTNADGKYGFPCWEDFFIRPFLPGLRPIASPDDDTVIVHACESAPLQWPVSPVQLSDNFQGKNQNYSLINMLDRDPLAEKFVGGTVYQAFLSCLSYHQWHAPVSGTIVAQRAVAGTYYSQNVCQTFFGHFDKGTPDPAAPTWSQPYISSVAARGLIFIKADNPAIGLICFMAIGMTDTSGLQFDYKPGHHFNKGDVMGRFHFGGSTYCLIFGPHVNLDWTGGIPPKNDPLWPTSLDDPVDNMPDFPVCSQLATVSSVAKQ